MSLQRLIRLAVVGACPWLAVPLAAQRGMQSEDHVRLKTPSDPRLSPDGSRVAFEVGGVDAQMRRRSRVWLARVDASEPARPFTAAGVSDSAPRFSPDGRFLAFLSTRAG